MPRDGPGLKLLGGRPTRVTTGHLQISVCYLPAPTATGAHNACFHRVQDDMSQARSVCRDWEFVSKGTEISLGKFVSEYFTSLTLDSWSGVVSTEDTDEIWKTAKEEGEGQRKGEQAMEKVKGRTNRLVGTESPMVEEPEVEKSFWLIRPDDWVIDKQENEEDYSSGFQKDLRLWGVLLQGHVEGGREEAHPYHDRS